MPNTAHGSVSEMVDSLTGGDSLAEELKQRIAQRQVVKALQAMRVAQDIPQLRIAEELNCTQSRVSKIERGDDCDLKLGEIEAYARALNCEMKIVFAKRGETALNRIQRSVGAIQRELDRLASRTPADETIAAGVASFFGEAFFNLVRIMEHASQQLPQRADGEPVVRIDWSPDDGRTMSDLSPGESDAVPVARAACAPV